MSETRIIYQPSRPGGRNLFGHPAGLTVLFLTEMWAQFSYFGLQANLVYYMTGELNFSQTQSSLIYGLYGATAFFSPFFGGIISDRWLGPTRSVVFGGVLMMLGHFAMALPSLLLPALALVALGNGLFVPPLAVQVGNLYHDDDPRKSHAFSVYYMGINVGAFLAPLVCGSLGEIAGWHYGFAAAGVGMFAGLCIYLAFRSTLPAERPRTVKTGSVAPKTAPRGSRTWLMQICALIAVVVLFRIGYEQSGNVIALWIQQKTDRSIALGGMQFIVPATWFQSINPLLIIALTPLFLAVWRRSERMGRSTNLPWRMSLGCVFASIAMWVMVTAAAVQATAGQEVSSAWVLSYFVLLTIGELMVLPVGLTLISSLAPAEVAGAAMGAWYIAKFLGSLLAGVLGSYWGEIPATWFFSLGALSCLAGSALLLLWGMRQPSLGQGDANTGEHPTPSSLTEVRA